MAILLLAEHNDGVLSEQTSKTLTAALKIGNSVDVLVAGKGVQEIAKAASLLSNVSKVLVADSELFENSLAEPLSTLILDLAANYDTIIAAATSTGKSVLPRVAANLDVQQVSEIIDVVSSDTFKRPIYAGNAIETVQTTGSKQVITVRTASFAQAPSEGSSNIDAIDVHNISNSLSTFVSTSLAKSDRPDLSSAKIIVAGGRALGSQEKFNEVLLPLADKLRGAVGASRAAVDAGYAPNDWQVGQTGKVVAPDLYVACGISGAIQHLAGMKDSKIIVAINKDEDAPIFQVADYGLVGDLFDIVPELTKSL